jgi:HAD superfamily hydrolase (TIGR01450 family)
LGGTVAFVGLGAMGSRLALRLLEAGHPLVVWNRSIEKAGPLAAAGAVVAATPADAAARADALLTMVADPVALRAVAEGPDGIANGAHGSLTVIEMSTVGQAAVARLAAVLPEGTELIEAPVLGSVDEAEAGALRIFVGGQAGVVSRSMELLSVLGSPVHVGPLGCGQAAKLVANATLFATLGTLGEALALARGLGLSDAVAYEVLAATPLGAQAERRRHALESGSYPPRFRLALARKDADLIEAAAAAAGLDLRLLPAVRTWFADAEAAGRGGDDYTALLATIAAGPPGDGVRRSSPTAPRPRYDGLIVDLDGVVWLAGEKIDGSAQAVARLRADGVRVLFVTNDPASSRAELAARLTEIGIPATPADVMTSAVATARFLVARPHLARGGVFAVGSPSLQAELVEAGLRVVGAGETASARAVVVGGHTGFDYAELRAATTAVLNGAELYATGRDAVFPAPDGPWPATGAILAAVEAATGVTATVIGKPEPFLFEIARETLVGCEHIAVVGDHLLSDVAGAKRAGLDAILVLTGNTREDDVARSPVQPDLVLPDLRALPDRRTA